MVNWKHADQGLREREENKHISYNHLFKFYTKKCVSSVMGPILLLLEEITCIWLRLFALFNSAETVYLQGQRTKEQFSF